MTISWQFFAILAATPRGFTWHWQRQGTKTVTSAAFDFYFDCISDARRHGYRGELPPGPHAALERLPTSRAMTEHVLAPEKSATPLMITVSGMSSQAGKRRRAAAASEPG